MTLSHILRPLTFVALALSLAACGNETGGSNVGQTLRNIPKLLSGRKAAPPQVSPQLVEQALANTTDPIVLIQVESNKAQFLLLQIEKNGLYATFGNAQRQAIIFRNGMITSSRGLGGDLMSSGSDVLLNRVSRRAEGQVPYVLRFLTPEDVTLALTLSCTVTRGKDVALDVGRSKRRGTTMTATCSGSGVTFTDTFIVAPNGFILSTRQWMGPTLGYLAAQFMRT